MPSIFLMYQITSHIFGQLMAKYLTLDDLIQLVQKALKENIDGETIIFANVAFSWETPAPVKYLQVGK